MALLATAHDAVGGDVISAGATVNYDLNTFATEIQAGSYALMDTAFAPMAPAFRPAFWVEATVISVSPRWAVADCGLKSLGMDHGGPTVDGARVLVVSDEHLTFQPDARRCGWATASGSGPRTWIRRSRTTSACRSIDGEDVVESWPVDLRGW